MRFSANLHSHCRFHQKIYYPKRVIMPGKTKFSDNLKVNCLIENITAQISLFLEDQARELARLTEIGIAIGSGRDISLLLEMILAVAREYTRADGGTLYLVDNKKRSLEFNVLHNDTLNVKLQAPSIDLPPVALYRDDQTPNMANVSSYVFHTGETVNIKDIYRTRKFDFSGTKFFDKNLKYKSRSMIVVPMKNHENDIIGILQLINALNPFSGKISPFTVDNQERASALASLASVLLSQKNLINEMKELFNAFVRAIAVLIDEKSQHTGGHIQRVTKICMMIAQAVNTDKTVFKSTLIDDNGLEELRIAALLHDTGKITTPEHIIDKSSKLESVNDRIEIIKLRFDLFKSAKRLEAEKKKQAAGKQNKKIHAEIDKACAGEIEILENQFQTLAFINSAHTPVSRDLKEKLDHIYRRKIQVDGKEVPCLSDDEYENLSIEKGTLSVKERQIINNHAVLTKKVLSTLPWPKKLAGIPEITGSHHEKLDGSGYPCQLTKKNLGLSSRILAIADIFEALSASDRPYKKAEKLSTIVKLLSRMGQNGELDNDIITIFFKSGLHVEYAKDNLPAEQLDI